MAIISLIAAIDEAGGLGFNNQLLSHLPADLQHFKKMTMGKPILMGRKTFASIGKPLPGRTNIVLSRATLTIEGIHVFDSLANAIQSYQDVEEIMIIGGAEIYKQAMSFANRLYITHIHHHFVADVFFPPIDKSIWHCQSTVQFSKDNKNSYNLSFCIYEKK